LRPTFLTPNRHDGRLTRAAGVGDLVFLPTQEFGRVLSLAVSDYKWEGPTLPERTTPPSTAVVVEVQVAAPLSGVVAPPTQQHPWVIGAEVRVFSYVRLYLHRSQRSCRISVNDCQLYYCYQPATHLLEVPLLLHVRISLISLLLSSSGWR
jgi:hypothetical protein